MNEDVSVLISQVLSSVVYNEDKEEIIFTTDKGDKYKLYHNQYCCEEVYIEDICGDLNDLVGLVVEAEVVISDGNPKPNSSEEDKEYNSFTWSFYKFRTVNGFVTIRWYGDGHGHYSEEASFEKIEEDEEDE